MATKTVVESGDGCFDFTKGDAVCRFDWEIHGHDYEPDIKEGMMVATNWVQRVIVESVSVNGDAMTPAEAVLWASSHADEILDFASEAALSAFERMVD